MKPHRFPFSLSSCVAFEATFRHGSFSRAAEELNLTQAAVSYQVRKLESDLGVTLFRRHPRPMAPTDAGTTLHLYVEQAFEILSSGSQAVSRTQSQKRRLVISVAQSIGAKWFLSRLPDIQAAVPNRQIELDLADEIVDLGKPMVDVAVRYIRKGLLEKDPGLFSAPLFATEEIFPVCDPMTARLFREQTPDVVFKSVPLLKHRKPDVSWDDWFDAVKLSGINRETAITFSHHSTMIDASVSGQGICLGRSPLVYDELEAGRLEKPFETSLESQYGYYVICLSERASEPEIDQLVRYLRIESTKSSKRSGQMECDARCS